MIQYLLQGHKCLFGYKQQSIHDIMIKYTFYIYPEKKKWSPFTIFRKVPK